MPKREKFPPCPYEPWNGYIVVVRDDPVTKVGNIEIPEHHRVMEGTGTVMAVAPEVENLEVGDRVLFPKFAGTQQIDEVGEEKIEWLFLYPREVLAKIDRDA